MKPDDVAFGQGTLAAFLTSLAGAVVPGLNSQALYISNAGGAPVLEVRTGQTQLSGLGPAGVDPAATFASIGRPDVSGVNHVAFLGGLSVGVGPVTAANDQGVWRNVGGTTELVLREGDAVPDEDGNPTGDLFESFDHPVVNTSGRVVVSALTSGGRALFGEASSGTFLRLLAAGDNVDISDGLGGTVAVTVADVSYVGAGGGSSTGPYKAFNDTGFVLAYATMTTGESSLILILVP